MELICYRHDSSSRAEPPEHASVKTTAIQTLCRIAIDLLEEEATGGIRRQRGES